MSRESFQARFDVSHETIVRLDLYVDTLRKWQKAINLVSHSTLDSVWDRHFTDSAQLSSFLPEDARIADLGSGGGFPGLVLKLMRPDLEIHLIESDERKCQFLKTVSRETGVKPHIHMRRAEHVLKDIAPQIITARAFASLANILRLVEPLLDVKQDLKLVLLKGRQAGEEIAEAQKRYVFQVDHHQSLTDKEASILCLDGIKIR